MNLNNKQEDQINELIKFCAQPSVSAENRGMEDMVDIVEEKLKELGAGVKRVQTNSNGRDSYPFLLADLKAKTNSESKKTVLIYNHYDVQPEDPIDLWETPPFEPTIKEDKFYVRGVSDNKGNMLMRIQGVRQLLEENNGDLPVNIKWIIEGEEEIGSPNLHPLQEQYGNFWKDSDVCIWETGGVTAKGEPVLKLGMKGIAYIELSCEFNRNDIHSGDAAIFDSPVWRLVHALASIRDVDGRVTVEGLSENILHPTNDEISLMENSNFDADEYAESAGAEKTLVESSNKLEFQKQMYFTNTANICGIWGGYTVPGGIKTILPNKATAKLDFRLVPEVTVDEVLDKLSKHLDAKGFKDVKVKYLIGEEYGKSKIENEHIQKCLEVMKSVYELDPEVTITTLGSGPIHYIAGVYDIPVVQIGTGYPGCNAHAPNEHIRLPDYFSGMRAFTKFLTELEN